MKYAELRKKAQDGFRDLTDEQIGFNVEDNSAQLKLDLIATTNNLSKQERELVLLKSREKLNANELINKILFIEDLKKAIIVLEKLTEELF